MPSWSGSCKRPADCQSVTSCTTSGIGNQTLQPLFPQGSVGRRVQGGGRGDKSNKVSIFILSILIQMNTSMRSRYYLFFVYVNTRNVWVTLFPLHHFSWRQSEKKAASVDAQCDHLQVSSIVSNIQTRLCEDSNMNFVDCYEKIWLAHLKNRKNKREQGPDPFPCYWKRKGLALLDKFPL